MITIDHMRHMKDQAIVCNIGHFDSEIQIEALRNYPWEEVKPQVDDVVFPDGKRLIVSAKGLINLGCAHRPPELSDERLPHLAGAGPDRALHQPRQIRETRSTSYPSTPRRRSAPSTSTSSASS
jgi:hypothetical protein